MSSDGILSVDGLTMRFGGIVAVNDLSFGAGASENHRADRTERRRQDHGVQLHHRLLQADLPAPCGSPTITALEIRLERLNDFRISKQGKVARTFQNIRLFPGMTALENLMVAQHNALMRASGLTLFGPDRRAVVARGGESPQSIWQNSGSTASGYWIAPTTPPAICPMATSAVSKSRARCAPSRPCCASTSPPPD